MKYSKSGDEGGGKGEKKNGGGSSMAMKKRNQRLGGGGGGLSLEAFANAKTKGGYNPAIIKKQREFYKNAKCVNKYKKALKQQYGEQSGRKSQQSSQWNRLTPDAPKPPQDGEESGKDMMKIKNKVEKKNNNNSLQSLREMYVKQHEEEEKARKEKEVILKAKQEQREMAETRRKEMRLKMVKKTRSGQPVMKYRIEQILQTLQASTK